MSFDLVTSFAIAIAVSVALLVFIYIIVRGTQLAEE